MLRLVGSSLDITFAINDFIHSYRQDFTNVRKVAQRYLKAESTSGNAALLAQEPSTARRNEVGGSEIYTELGCPKRNGNLSTRASIAVADN